MICGNCRSGDCDSCRRGCDCQHSLEENALNAAELSASRPTDTLATGRRRVRRVRGKATDQTCIECDEAASDWNLRTNSDPLDPNSYDPRCRKHSMFFRSGKSEPSYRTVHRYLVEKRGRADEHSCIDCGEEAHDWSQKYDSDPFDLDSYDPRCRSCHLKYDRTGENNGHSGRTVYGRVLSEDDIEKIASSSDTVSNLAKEFNVSKSTIRRIRPQGRV